MNVLIGLIVTYVVFVCETSLVPLLGWGALAPRPVLAALVWGVWRSDCRAGLLLAATWGLIADGLSTGPMGIDVVVYVVAAAIVQSIRNRAPDTSLIFGTTTGFIAFAIPVAGVSLQRAIQQDPFNVEQLWGLAAGSACCTAVLAAFLFCASRFMFGRPTTQDSDPVAHVSNRWKMLTE